MTMTRQGGAYDDGMADDVSLVLIDATSNVCSFEPPCRGASPLLEHSTLWQPAIVSARSSSAKVVDLMLVQEADDLSSQRGCLQQAALRSHQCFSSSSMTPVPRVGQHKSRVVMRKEHQE